LFEVVMATTHNSAAFLVVLLIAIATVRTSDGLRCYRCFGNDSSVCNHETTRQFWDTFYGETCVKGLFGAPSATGSGQFITYYYRDCLRWQTTFTQCSRSQQIDTSRGVYPYETCYCNRFDYCNEQGLIIFGG